MPKKPEKILKPHWTTADESVRLFLGDALTVLREMPSRSVHMAVTSPPYWGLRDYGTGEWEGGDPSCQHSKPEEPKPYLGSDGKLGRNMTNWDNRHGDKRRCRKCGARRIDAQLGSEERPDCLGWARGVNCAETDWSKGCHVCRMVLVFRELRRVLRNDGVLFLNYGDTYNQNQGKGFNGQVRMDDANRNTSKNFLTGLPSGNLVGVPWRVALALQADGWVLRQDIIWAKPSPMPESVRNRCTKSHEHIFVLAKGEGYFWDAEAIREDPKGNFSGNLTQVKDKSKRVNEDRNYEVICGANKRDVWTISSQGYPGAHFATFPPKLVEPCILAGTSAFGACARCGRPWERVVSKIALVRERPNDYVKRTGQEGTGNSCPNSAAGVETNTLGWRKACRCSTCDVVPCVVCDPFMGSGTTAAVAVTLGRRAVGIELSRAYIEEHAAKRINEALRKTPWGFRREGLRVWQRREVPKPVERIEF